MRKNKLPKSSLSNLTQGAISALLYLYNQMIKKLALVSIWILAAPTLILASAFFLTLEKNSIKLPTVSAPYQIQVQPQNQIVDVNTISSSVIATEIKDIRPILVEKFLKKTPLAQYSTNIVQVSDKYGIDWRLIPAIAMKESGGGSAIPSGSFNAWGFENGKTHFTSWESAIDRVGKTLKDRYISKGLTTPDQIMAVYAPPALLNGGGWAKDVNFFFTQMETL